MFVYTLIVKGCALDGWPGWFYVLQRVFAEIMIGVGLMSIVDLADRRPPVCYTVRLAQYWDGRLQITVEDVADDERTRKAVADALRRAADGIERGEIK